QGTKTIVLPNSVIALYFLLVVAFLAGARLLARSVHDRPIRGFRAGKDAREVLIVGAGDGGRLVLREILRNPELGLRPVGFVEDVLGREPVRMELDVVGAYLEGQTVLVTGAGGSIGSELCRQITRVGPRRLVALDHAEDNLFSIVRELEDERHVHPSVVAAVL